MQVRRIRLLVVPTILIAVFLLVAGCNHRKEWKFSGATMGTTYHVAVVAPFWNSLSRLERLIEQELTALNQSMSVYDPQSEISRFNAMTQPGDTLEISDRLADVLAVSGDVWRRTRGAFDPTAFPLVKLWGFNTDRSPNLPDAAAIEAVRQRVGFDHVRFDARNRIGKTIPNVEIDLSAIAKGYGVDRVAGVVRNAGHTDFLVEIGGEIFVAGKKADGRPWKIGINYPDVAAPPDLVYKTLLMSDRAVATSGNYRNFRHIEGKRYTHIIDPQTGRPIDNGVLSVTVLADTCALADGLATGLMVMGPEQAIPLVEQWTGIECLFLLKDAEGKLIEIASSGFGIAP